MSGNKPELKELPPLTGVDTSMLSELEGRLLLNIENNPGIRYRELLRLTGLVNGVLSYHLATLERSELIVVQRSIRETRYFPANVTSEETKILRHLRNKPERQIIIQLLKQEMCTFRELMECTSKTPSMISTYTKRLANDGIITVKRGQTFNLYSIKHHEAIAEILSKYKQSFTDKIVDNYSEIVEGI